MNFSFSESALDSFGGQDDAGKSQRQNLAMARQQHNKERSSENGDLMLNFSLLSAGFDNYMNNGSNLEYEAT